MLFTSAVLPTVQTQLSGKRPIQVPIYSLDTSTDIQPLFRLIAPFQKGETPTFIAHIKSGLRILVEQPQSLLIFSGHAPLPGSLILPRLNDSRARTKASATPLSESQSYLNCARANDFFGFIVNSKHITTEDQATDSYQNLLFSLLRFKRVTHHYPTHITIVSHAFKRRRFLELHAKAIRWPLERVSYLGIDPPEEITPRRTLEEGEERDGFGRWVGDLYGVGEVLARKRVGRGWKGVYEGFLDEHVRALLEWKSGEGGREVFGGRLPWDEVGVAR
ncbi:MAG: hypothetical protein M1830_000084 [Pleopsidium flavum]|nr:MAG: hypothetical protein M1830_000084 [Pleopsidium flavum]